MLTITSAMRSLRACKTADDVADVLRAAELPIRGVRHDDMRCPVATLLKRALDGRGHMYVSGVLMGVRRNGSCDWRTFDTPDAVTGFVTEFDEGRYPDFALCEHCGGDMEEAAIDVSARCKDCGEVTFADCPECGGDMKADKDYLNVTCEACGEQAALLGGEARKA